MRARAQNDCQVMFANPATEVRDFYAARLKSAAKLRNPVLKTTPSFFTAVLALLSVTLPQTALAQNHAGHPSLLKTARSIHRLTEEEAASLHPVHLRAVVTYYDPHMSANQGGMFVHDATGGIYVALSPEPMLPLREGSLVEVDGVARPGFFAPLVEGSRVQIIGRSPIPRKASPVTRAQWMTGAYDGQWVEVEGQVHSVVTSGLTTVLRIATSDGMISATTISESGADYNRLVDAQVQIHANAGPEFNERRQLIGVQFYLPSLRDVTIRKAAPIDPYAAPLRHISKLLQYMPGTLSSQRVHIRGRVTLQWPQRSLCIRDATGGLCVQTSQSTPGLEGKLVDVVGFPEVADATPTLVDAVFRPAGDEREPLSPAPLTPWEAIQNDHAEDLIQLEGTLISFNSGPRDLEILISANGILFPAVLPKSALGQEGSKWTEGSKLRIVGICSPAAAEGINVHSRSERFAPFRILLRSSGDVTVLKTPSWWTGAHAAAVLIGVAFTTLVVLFWVAVLRRRVGQQLQLIRQSEERYRHLAQHDVLTGLPNRALLHDRLGVALERAKRNQTCLAVFTLDLDKFKQVNDSFGHHAGDLLLCAASDRVSALVRKADTVARMGGDEFIVLLSDLPDAERADEIAAKMVAAVSAPLQIGTRDVPISVSIGICTFPLGGTSVAALLQNADAALYQAKALGRNRYKRFTPEGTIGQLSRSPFPTRRIRATPSVPTGHRAVHHVPQGS